MHHDRSHRLEAAPGVFVPRCDDREKFIRFPLRAFPEYVTISSRRARSRNKEPQWLTPVLSPTPAQRAFRYSSSRLNCTCVLRNHVNYSCVRGRGTTSVTRYDSFYERFTYYKHVLVPFSYDIFPHNNINSLARNPHTCTHEADACATALSRYSHPIQIHHASVRRQRRLCPSTVTWVFPFEELLIRVKRGQSIGEKMAASFFGITGNYATIVLKDKKTVTASWYTNNCLPLVLEIIREKRPHTRIFLHHDNGSQHAARPTANNLGMLGTEYWLTCLTTTISHHVVFTRFLIKENFEQSDLQTPRKQWLHMKTPSK
ncbi:hypothetical protein EVAR_40065_1 [Eumeta japonica]|uniref:Mariner Mos1 transposase n=1 Tax=Eumeta variegata TaxID=151549 RepID=A0A4C1WAZ3_EUMVA|nr:hypothetical protein EVAR_40065_1 [Eumeta japonica]